MKNFNTFFDDYMDSDINLYNKHNFIRENLQKRTVTTSTTAEPDDEISIDTSESISNIEILLPASPSKGDTIYFVDIGCNLPNVSAIIKPNGKKIMGFTDDILLNSSIIRFALVYDCNKIGWRIKETYFAESGVGAVATTNRTFTTGLDGGDYCGDSITGVAGATISFGNLIYLSSIDARWELANASASATTKPLMGMCVLDAASNGSNTKILVNGTIGCDDFPSLTIGLPVYVDIISGAITQSAPFASTNCVRVIGHAIEEKEIYFNPSTDYITIL